MIDEFVELVLSKLGLTPTSLGEDKYRDFREEHTRLLNRSIALSIAETMSDGERSDLSARLGGSQATPSQLLENAYDHRPLDEVNRLLSSAMRDYATALGITD